MVHLWHPEWQFPTVKFLMKKIVSVCQTCTYYLILACWPDSGGINQNMNSAFSHLPKKIQLPKNGIISEGSTEDLVEPHRKAASHLLQYYCSPKSRFPQRGRYPPHSRNLTHRLLSLIPPPLLLKISHKFSHPSFRESPFCSSSCSSKVSTEANLSV